MNRTPAARSHRSQSGVTLIELMVSLVIVSIAVAATFALGFSMMNAYREHRRMIDVERSARVSMEIVADAIRLGSAGVPTGNIEDRVGCSGTQAIRITNSDTAPDEVVVFHASGGVLTAIMTTYNGASTQLQVFDATGLKGADTVNGIPGDYVIVTDGAKGHLVQIEKVTVGSAGEQLLDLVASPCGAASISEDFAPGSLVIRAQPTRFYIDDVGGVNSVPVLMMDPDGAGPELPEPIAQGIEDMQIAVGVDDDEDGAIEEDTPPSNLDEWRYNTVGDTPPDALGTAKPWRAIRLTLVARSIYETSSKATFTRPAAEDRAAGSVPDVYRRRVLSSVLEIRNLEGSPL